MDTKVCGEMFVGGECVECLNATMLCIYITSPQLGWNHSKLCCSLVKVSVLQRNFKDLHFLEIFGWRSIYGSVFGLFLVGQDL